MRKKTVALFLAMTFALSMVGCGSSTTQSQTTADSTAAEVTCPNEGDPLTVATMVDTEGGTLGKIIVEALENAGFEIDDQTQTAGSTSIIRELATTKEADITLYYTGNGMYIMDDVGNDVWLDYTAGYEKIRDYDKENNGLEWLTPAPANNTELLAITKEFAEENNIVTMYDFANYINNGGTIKLYSYEYWLESTCGLPAFEETYGFEIPEENIVTGDVSLTEVANGTDGLNCAMVYTTDGRIEELGLYVIEDPENIPPVYSPAPIVASEVLEKYPQIAEILNPIFEGLSTDTLISLNYKVQSEGRTAEDVAKEYLTENGFIN